MSKELNIVKESKKAILRDIVSKELAQLLSLEVIHLLSLLFVVYYYSLSSPSFVIVLSLIVAFQLYLHWILLNEKKESNAELLLLLHKISLWGYWILVCCYFKENIFLIKSYFLLTSFLYVFLYLSWKEANILLVFSFLMFSLLLYQLNFNGNVYLYFSLYPSMIIIPIFLGRFFSFNYLTSLWSLILARVSEEATSLEQINLFFYAIKNLVSANFLLLQKNKEGNELFLLDDNCNVEDKADNQGIALFNKCLATGAKAGIISLEGLSISATTGIKSKEALFFFLEYRHNQKTNLLLLTIPFSAQIKLIGANKVFRNIYILYQMVYNSLQLAISRAKSSVQLLGTEENLSKNKMLFLKLLHKVNNISQDLISIKDSLSQKDNQDKTARNDYTTLSRLSDAISVLGAEINDVGITFELNKIKLKTRKEGVLLDFIIKPILSFYRYYSCKKEVDLELVLNYRANTFVSLSNKRLVEVALRELLRISISLSDVRIDKASLKVEEGSSNVHLTVSLFFNKNIEDKDKALFFKKDSYLSKILAMLKKGGDNYNLRIKDSNISLSWLLPLSTQITSQFSLNQSKGWALVVDDNIDIAQYYSKLMTAFNLEALSFASLQEAKKTLQNKGAPTLIITDIGLVDGSGIDLVKFAKEEQKLQCPIIVVSGENQEEVRGVLDDLKVDQFLTKPVSRSDLIQVVKGVLGAK